ncbi:hypothetical protein [Sporosarcina sp. BP05]|uniref:hypothetical protein n=1 Tax=Sporosarcina sp. BP05 TaxID=2758726 RepID=UPI00164560C7|nr:hypothetical protein [Sporosarcina sp. BP05]
MKNYIRKWLVENKILLITFCVTSVITFITTLIEVKFILSNLEDLDHYATTGIISDGLKNVALLGLFDLVLMGFWMLLLLLILWKVIFPSSGTVKNAFFANDLNFLMDMPSRVRREIDKK